MEKSRYTKVAGESSSSLPPPPPMIPPNVKPEIIKPSKYSITNRCGVGTCGKKISLLANHFQVFVKKPDTIFYHYTVKIYSEDNKIVEGKGIGRKIIDKLYQTYSSELAGKRFAYDGERSLYVVDGLPQSMFEFPVVLEESFAKGSVNRDGSPVSASKKSKRSFRSKIYKVELNYSAKVPLKSIFLALQGDETDNCAQDALRVLDTILRHHATNRGCLLVRQSFFQDDQRNCFDAGGGVQGLRGFHSSFRLTQGGLSLNTDVSTTVVLTPGPVLQFLKLNKLDFNDTGFKYKAKKLLKNLRIRTIHNNMEFRITGLSDKSCYEEKFQMKVKKSGSGEVEIIEITVYDYFTKHCGIRLEHSANKPCINVGKPKKPNYLPMELCTLVPLQRYTKALSSSQRVSLVQNSRQNPHDRIKALTNAVRSLRYDEDHILSKCGISMRKELTEVDGRVLEAPKLRFGDSMNCVPNNGRWNFNNKRLLDPKNIQRWVVVNFSSRQDINRISRNLITCASTKGMVIEPPLKLIEEDRQATRASPPTRVDLMFEQIMEKLRINGELPAPPELILCVLPEKKNSPIYGPWKKKCLSDMGIRTQCISPDKISDQYLTNLLLKINTKLGGINSLLEIEHPSSIPLIKDTPTLILGMDVSHGSPGQSNIPSIAAVVGSRCWPLISRYKASVRAQSPKVEMIDALYKPLPNGKDDGIIRELLLEFYKSSRQLKPKQIIVFRDGVSESQFNHVLNIELEQIIKAYRHLEEHDNVKSEDPKFAVIVAQKNHHTKLFQAKATQNVPPGTVVDTKIVHQRNYDFYMCSHAGVIGTSRPAHYHVLLDEIGFCPNDLQNLINALSYVYQRSTTAVSIVAPICYAHLAAQQMGQFLRCEGTSEASSLEMTYEGSIPFPDLPRLNNRVAESMFFC